MLFVDKVSQPDAVNSLMNNEENSGSNSWYSWAWSYLPSFTDTEDESTLIEKGDNLSANFGFYCDEISICLKVIFIYFRCTSFTIQLARSLM